MSKPILGKYYSVHSLNNEVEERTYPCTDSLMRPLGRSSTSPKGGCLYV